MTRKAVALISDVLYLAVAFQLVRVLTCVQVGDEVVLLADTEVQCWKGNHLPLAMASAIGLSFYISLSVMLAPLIIASENSVDDANDDEDEVEEESELSILAKAQEVKEKIVFVKPYMMLTVCTSMISSYS